MSRVVDGLARRPWPAVAALILLFGAMAWFAVREKSSTFDEIAHLTAGTSYWLTGDYRLQPENGNLPQRWVTLPLLADGLHFPDRADPHWHSSNVWELGYDFFYTLGNELEQMLWRGRGMVVLLGMTLGVIVFVWSRWLFGVGGGFLSLVMYVFCPSLLAHSALATSDMAATLMFVAALGCVWIALHRVSRWSVLTSGLVLGGLFVSKMSAVVILPVMLILLVIRIAVGRPLVVVWRGEEFILFQRARQFGALAGVVFCQALLVVLVIWSFYGFCYATFRDAAPDRDRMPGNRTVESLAGDGMIGKCVRLANDRHLLPEPYLYGFAFAIEMSKSRVAFLNGEFSEDGWRTFFPYALLVKTPLPTMALLMVALLAAIQNWRREAWSFYRVAPLVVFLVVYWAIAIASNLNIGHRHILPAYPIMFILGGAAADWFRSRRALVRAVPVLLAAWLMIDSVSMYPHYLAYFNQLAGGPRNGYRHLVDSSLDWGQDLPGLKRWLNERRDSTSQQQPTYLSYFGVGSPDHYGLAVRQLPAFPDWRTQREPGDIEPGTYCISATNLQSVYLPPRGPWTLESEQQYQTLLAAVASVANQQQGAAWNNTLSQFELYRFARLCAYLRLREPDDSVGHSILIYNLDAESLNTALFRPISDWPVSASHNN